MVENSRFYNCGRPFTRVLFTARYTVGLENPRIRFLVQSCNVLCFQSLLSTYFRSYWELMDYKLNLGKGIKQMFKLTQGVIAPNEYKCSFQVHIVMKEA